MDVDWGDFYDAVEGRGTRSLATRALDAAAPVRPGARALDLGCGDGLETLALADAGYRVLAVDGSAEGVRRTRERTAGVAERVEVEVGDFSTWRPPTGFDLVLASLSLPFCPPRAFPALWSATRDAVAPGGLLAVDLFGDRDTWAGEPEMSTVSRGELDALLAGLEVLVVDELEEDRPDALGHDKHWHILTVLARRP